MSRGPNVVLFQMLLGAGFFIAMAMKSWRLRPAPQPAPAPARAPRTTPREMRRLLQLPSIALATAPAGDAGSVERPRFGHEVPPATMAGLQPATGSRYSVYLMLASVAALIALGVMYAAVTGGNRTNRTLTALGPPPAAELERAGGVSAESSPSVADLLLDSRRKLDLGQLRDALDAYGAFVGEYPSTWDAWAPFCVEMGDRGCLVVAAHGGGLSTTNSMRPYWYQSDGRIYTLLAQVATWPATDDCPEAVPAEVLDGPMFCVSGSLAKP